MAKKIGEGRPLLALGTWLFLHTATDIEDLRSLRFMGIVGIALLAWSVFHILVRTGWSRVQSFCVGVIMGTHLPVTVVAADDPIDPPPDSLVVDMGKLLRQAQRSTRRL